MPKEIGQNTGHSATTGRLGKRPYGVFILSLLIRALHQVGAAVFLAAGLFNDLPVPSPYLSLALVSGGLLLGAEWWRHRQLHRELAGTITLGKLLLLGAAYHGLLPLQETLLLAFVGASLGAHAPKQARHRLMY